MMSSPQAIWIVVAYLLCPLYTARGRWVCLSSPPPHPNHYISAFFFLKKVFCFETISFWLSPSSLLVYHLSHLSLSAVCPHPALLSTVYHWKSWRLAHRHPWCPAIILGGLKVHVDKPLVTLTSQFLSLLISSNLYYCTLSIYIHDLSSLELFLLWNLTCHSDQNSPFPQLLPFLPQHQFLAWRELQSVVSIFSQIGALSWFIYILYSVSILLPIKNSLALFSALSQVLLHVRDFQSQANRLHCLAKLLCILVNSSSLITVPVSLRHLL